MAIIEMKAVLFILAFTAQDANVTVVDWPTMQGCLAAKALILADSLITAEIPPGPGAADLAAVLSLRRAITARHLVIECLDKI